MIRWKALVRDVIIILALTGIGGFVVGMLAAREGRDLSMEAVGISSIILSIVGFTLAGCMSKTKRFSHLFHVAVVVWLLSCFNMLFPSTGLVECVVGAIVILIVMLIGGGISFIFVKTSDKDSQPAG